PAILALLLNLIPLPGLPILADAASLALSADVGIAIAAAHLNADRRPDEAEFLPQLIDQETLVGKVERRGDVREEDERRRGDANLRRVQDANVPAARAHRRICRGDRFDERVERRGRHPCAYRRGHPGDRFAAFSRAPG